MSDVTFAPALERVTDFQDITVALPATVYVKQQWSPRQDVPPTLALLASSTSRRVKPKSLPRPRIMAKCTPICSRQNTKSEGAVRTTAATLPLAPTCITTCILRLFCIYVGSRMRGMLQQQHEVVVKFNSI